MTYILAAQRDGSPAETVANFERYRAYLEEHQPRFPPSAYQLATSSWYYSPNDHRCPHDAWLDRLTIQEVATGERQEQRTTVLEIRLLGAYHDRYITLRYPHIFAYQLDTCDARQGHRDWRYDEFRLLDSGHLLHEIEWAGMDATSRWIIQASDVEFTWEPVGPAESRAEASN